MLHQQKNGPAPAYIIAAPVVAHVAMTHIQLTCADNSMGFPSISSLLWCPTSNPDSVRSPEADFPLLLLCLLRPSSFQLTLLPSWCRGGSNTSGLPFSTLRPTTVWRGSKRALKMFSEHTWLILSHFHQSMFLHCRATA